MSELRPNAANDGRSPEADNRPRVSFHIPDDTPKITISEHSARLLMTLCDRVTIPGVDGKVRLGMAQMELATELAKLEKEKKNA